MNNDSQAQAPALRNDIPALYALKLEAMRKINSMIALDVELNDLMETIESYPPVRVDWNYSRKNGATVEQYIDYTCWGYLVRSFHLEKYMLCTEYKKMLKEIEEYKTPPFNPENAEAWLASLKALIYENMKTLVHHVFASITDGTYYVGGGYRGTEKKRNNNGVDKSFILHTGDLRVSWDWYTYCAPTVTDDLEKVCYLLSGDTLPDITAKMAMEKAKTLEYSCKFFSLKLCKNGNTHYTLADDVREKLNRYGPEGAILGEDIKIKIVERKW